ncbi:hypothetical protein HaLaN_02545 [Haematococcus lacustris]|uniref:Uncharacterized protein n=1 Tax=Haematococcus lacustris TaxID=44745 RepID=A0A699YIJ7_HAELA|nr:hypothetical protein HaLaN_02545 [Haematococcus lacustris]
MTEDAVVLNNRGVTPPARIISNALGSVAGHNRYLEPGPAAVRCRDASFVAQRPHAFPPRELRAAAQLCTRATPV